MKLRKATPADIPVIWEILQHGIKQRKKDGSEQWQNGYPNQETIREDLDNSYANVLTDENEILAYAALIEGIEPAYNIIEGKWLNEAEYITVHRVASAGNVRQKGIGTSVFKEIENACLERKIYNIRVDTSFDNVPMLKILDKLNYVYCGEVMMSGAPRRAYQKQLQK